MIDRRELWHITDGMSVPLYRAQGAVATLYRLCDAVDKEESTMLAFLVDGLSGAVKDLQRCYDTLSDKLTEKPEQPGPQLVNRGEAS